MSPEQGPYGLTLTMDDYCPATSWDGRRCRRAPGHPCGKKRHDFGTRTEQGAFYGTKRGDPCGIKEGEGGVRHG